MLILPDRHNMEQASHGQHTVYADLVDSWRGHGLAAVQPMSDSRAQAPRADVYAWFGSESDYSARGSEIVGRVVARDFRDLVGRHNQWSDDACSSANRTMRCPSSFT